MTLSLEVQNAMPSAELAGTGDPAAISSLDSEIATRKRFRLELPSGTTRLAFGPPDASRPGPFRFALMSDVQEAIDDVQDVFQAVNVEPELRFLLGAGDLTQQGTHEQLQRYQRELESLGIPYYTTLGNHELGQNPSLYQDYFGRGNFQFDYRGVTFTLLDSASATIDPTVYEWLEGWLERARDRVHIVAMHIPPLDPTGVRNGAFASRAEAAKLLGRFADAGVDLTLYGHVHSFYEFDNAGIPAFISGGGGAIPERFDEMGRHFMVIDVAPDGGILGTRVVRVSPGGP
jgi:3',5'-cyclic AMP phosphodiesterase CpdA